jgi:hypothetical protein
MVRKCGTPEPGVDFVRDRAAANRFTTLEDEWLQPRLRQVKGSDEPVVSTANDDDAIGVRRQEATSCRRGFSWQHYGPGRP